MEEKKRICEDCGNKTNETTCPICGRKTVSLKTGHREQIFLKDKSMKKANWDLEMAGDQGDKESRNYHNEPKKTTLHMKKGEHPYYTQRNVGRNSTPVYQAVIIILVCIVIIGGLVAFFIAKSNGNPEEIYEPSTPKISNYEDFLYMSDENVSVSCKIEEKDGGFYLHVNNPSRYFVTTEYADKEEAVIVSDYKTLEPYSDQYLEVYEKYNGCVPIKESMSVQELNYYTPDYPYEYKTTLEDEITAEIYVKQDINEDEIRELVQYLYAGKKVAGNEKIDQYHLYINNKEDMAYSVYIDEWNYRIEFTPYGEYKEIPAIEFA